MSKTIGLIRVVTSSDENFLEAHGRLIEAKFPELRVISRCIEDHPAGLPNPEMGEEAVPQIVELGRRFASDGVDGLIVSCTYDPGVNELRQAIDIPVIGAGSAAASLALSLGRRVAVLGLTNGATRIMQTMLGPHLVAEGHPEGVTSTMDLLQEEGARQAFLKAESFREAGAEVIAMGCTGFSTIGLAGKIQKSMGLPVLDAIEAAGAVASFIL